MMNQKVTFERKERYDFNDLKTIMDILRSEQGCPWDREQTHESIRSCMIEEAYEVVEAIDTQNAALLREELGDVLFQVMFHSRIEFEKNEFSVDDVVNDICEKMIHRHPHVFGETLVTDSNAVLEGWEAIKTAEKQRNTLSSKLRAVPPMLPALMRGQKIAKKAGLCDETDAKQTQQRMVALASQLETNEKEQSTVIGELLMQVSVYCAKQGIDAEQALGRAIESEIRRVELLETTKK